MYARRQTIPKPLKAESRQWAAPSAGWISNRLLASPDSIEGPGAAVLDNFFPRSTGVQLRRGKELYATLEDESLNVISLFTYHNGLNEKLFGANATTIYDLSNVVFPSAALIVTDNNSEIETENGDFFGWSSTDGLDVAGNFTGGDWSVVQFATTGGVYLVGVNGEDTGFIYDGLEFYPNVDGGTSRLDFDAETDVFLAGEVVTGGTSGATGTIYKVVEGVVPGEGYLLITGVTGTFQDNEIITGATAGSATTDGTPVLTSPGVTFPNGLTSADMSFVWAYKNRLWFIQKNSLNAYYLPVDQIGGTAILFPMGGIFSNGGSLLFGARWSMENSGDGGLSDQNTFFTTAGDVAVYQGLSPDETDTWSIVGVYRTGAPLGKRAYIRGGGDIAVATDIGLVPLSKAISLDVTALNVATVSYKIADAWSEAIAFRGTENWQAYIWSQQKMSVIAPPDLVGSSFPVVFVTNTETGAWARYTNWMAYSFAVYKGELYFGSVNGKVFKANQTGMDDGMPYTGTVINLYDDMGASASAKVGKMARAVTRSNYPITDNVSILTDYRITPPSAPNAFSSVGLNTWGTGVWGTSIWGAEVPTVFTATWRSAGGIGHVIAPCYQVTSGSLVPLDVQLVSIDTTHTSATVVS